ncbi:MAG: ABC transporter ATP-binding protein [Planctomycetaceae bacterium]|nr:ABC transporter ATP-binding protein [Planctomycetaceae bacterium]
MDTMSDTTEPGIAFAFQQVTQQFSAGAQPVFRDLNLAIGGGRFVTIVGPSGCGKSTLLRLIAGLQTPTFGSVVHHPGATEQRVGFVFQHPTLLPWRTAAQNLCLPLELGPENSEKSSTAADGKSVISLLEQVGLAAHDAAKRPAEMSGGMQMRLSLARALATDPTILLLDEPFAAVDDFLRMRLQEDIRRLHEDRKLTTVLVTHNIQEAVFLSDQVVVFSGSPAKLRESVTIQWQGPREAKFRDSDEYVKYTRLLNSVLNQQHAGL